MAKTNRCTLFIEEDPSFLINGQYEQSTQAPEPSIGGPQKITPLQQAPVQTSTRPVDTGRVTRQRFPVKRSHGQILTPVVSGSPWKHYESRYRIKYWCSFGVVTRRDKSAEPYMIRTITGSKSEEQIQTIRQLCHSNLVEQIEIYACPESGHFILSEFMPTSLLHLCRSPIYPSEHQLSSILHQVGALPQERMSGDSSMLTPSRYFWALNTSQAAG